MEISTFLLQKDFCREDFDRGFALFLYQYIMAASVKILGGQGILQKNGGKIGSQ